MSERKVYFCDWCEVQSPTTGSVGHDWVVLTVSVTTHEHLCQACNNARLTALSQARKSRRPKATPAPGVDKETP